MWNTGDRIRLSLKMRGRVIYSPKDSKFFAAIINGPVVLFRDSHNDQETDIDEVINPFVKNNNFIKLTERSHPEESWMAFTADF